MTSAEREDLNKRRAAVEQEIATLKNAIIDIEQPASTGQPNPRLQSLRQTLTIRERELEDIKTHLS